MTGMTHMTCDECRQAIAVADLTDWGDMDGVAAHCHTCESCAAVVTDVRDSARRVAELLDGIPAGVSSALVARRAAAAAGIERQRRRRRRMLTYPTAAVAVTLLSVAGLFVGRQRLRERELRHVLLQCLSTEQAAALLAPVMGRDGAISFSERSPLRMLTLSGPTRLVGEAERLVAQIDNPGSLAPGESCAVPGTSSSSDMEGQARLMELDRLRAEQDVERARQDAERARQEVERIQQEAERSRQEAERARQAEAARRDR